jgi:lipopolysaccharide/colanic/teichoic acid biosynthesis glycosyltransferase
MGNKTKRLEIPTWKRVIDLGFILLTVPIWGPLITVVALFIKLVSRGPILFKQERVGYKGKPFTCLKFRSMKPNAETAIHESYLQRLMRSETPMTKLDETGDPRLIPFGRLLRATGLDELPQIFNVIRGEMSLVGPRPSTVVEFQHYRPEYHGRVNALPGITGYWQINGKNKTTFSQMIAMDLHYINNMNIWMDIAIMLRTVGWVVRQGMEHALTIVSPNPSLEIVSNKEENC